MWLVSSKTKTTTFWQAKKVHNNFHTETLSKGPLIFQSNSASNCQIQMTKVIISNTSNTFYSLMLSGQITLPRCVEYHSGALFLSKLTNKTNSVWFPNLTKQLWKVLLYRVCTFMSESTMQTTNFSNVWATTTSITWDYDGYYVPTEPHQREIYFPFWAV